MGLAERLNEYPKQFPKGPKCYVWIVLESFQGADREALEAALEPNSGWTATALLTPLRDEGHNLSKSSIERHRRGECACPRK